METQHSGPAPYRRRVQYYETDQMGVVHHSNYIRWFAEARTDFMRQIGAGYRDLEGLGLQIPVVGVSCAYKTPALFDETFVVETRLVSFNGVRICYRYEVRSQERGALLAEGESEHCFLDPRTGLPQDLKKRSPEHYAAMIQLLPKQDNV